MRLEKYEKKFLFEGKKQQKKRILKIPIKAKLFFFILIEFKQLNFVTFQMLKIFGYYLNGRVKILIFQ